MLGWRTADVCTIDFDDVHLPDDAIIGKPGRTLIYLAQALEFERLVAGLLAVGGTAFCVSLLDEFARSHRINGAALSANQAVRQRVAELSADLALVEQYGRYAAQQHALGRLNARVASILKLKATELAVTAAQACMQFHGARGYAADSAAARIYRDAAAGTIAAGPSELMRELIFDSR
jgi:alkylation response protein AidB-like acyl-CoA dehydrogenase